MNRILVFLSLFSLLWGSSTFASAAGVEKLNEEKWRNGQMIYELYCAVCHGYEGVPFNPRSPSFADGERMGKKDEDLYIAIINGIGEDDAVGQAMPAWGEIINEKERADVLYYIRKIISKGKIKKE
ncbi:MAG: hypothetical protein A3G18_05170 [Rhodospirillales bacterium RIFCSPLOWO2_12_FULL_58_28]|nr:MAG: hypothetical protein A3H92_05265 [Rhodospirillales bacterium RIFCSPLOWO2_02_FULL_58_16]OHC78299.1 MAG: hypothetical protein A3G18_05170 [Rhodospirillales bacterium RIFCSPLOWO2_12_FULL_58_28]